MSQTKHTAPVREQIRTALENSLGHSRRLMQIAAERPAGLDDESRKIFGELQTETAELIEQGVVSAAVEKNAAAACNYLGSGLAGPALFHLKQLTTQLSREVAGR